MALRDVRSITCSALALGLASASGCASNGRIAPVPGRQVSLAEFSASKPASSSISVEPAISTASSDASRPAIRLGAGTPPAEVPLREAGPVAVAAPNDAVPILVDSLIGQINGRPLYADDVLEPIEDQLIQEAKVSTPAEFQEKVQRIVGERMQAVVLNELYLAEAQSSLKPEEQRGLLFLLRSLREKAVASRGGSVARAEEQLLRKEGKSLEDFVADQKDTELVQNLFRQRIRPRIIVSWRDIEREYERRYDHYHPPATVTLSRIRLSPDTQPEQIEEVTRRLAAGDPFAEVAESVGMSDGGLLDTFTMGAGGFTEIDINADYKPFLEGLGEGDTTEPFSTRTRTMWLHVTSMNDSQGRDLYDADVQEELKRAVFSRRLLMEQTRYRNELLQKSSLEELDVMMNKIMVIALWRYKPS